MVFIGVVNIIWIDDFFWSDGGISSGLDIVWGERGCLFFFKFVIEEYVVWGVK